MKLNKAFKFRLLPNQAQIDLLAKTFGCCRFIYNKMLEDKIIYYQETKKHLSVTPARYKQEFEWLKEVDSYSLCNEQINLQTAFRNFFRNSKVGFPKFKSKKNDNGFALLGDLLRYRAETSGYDYLVNSAFDLISRAAEEGKTKIKMDVSDVSKGRINLICKRIEKQGLTVSYDELDNLIEISL